jgi:hypothetical protein
MTTDLATTRSKGRLPRRLRSRPSPLREASTGRLFGSGGERSTPCRSYTGTALFAGNCRALIFESDCVLIFRKLSQEQQHDADLLVGLR